MREGYNIYVAQAIFGLCLLFVVIWAVFFKTYEIGLSQDTSMEEEYEAYFYEDIRDNAISDWEIFINALIWVESKGDCMALGKHNDVGVLQITPILVKDCNRIVGYDKYTLEDRYLRDKSIEMFNVIQDHYNPQRDFHWALKLWNSGAPLSYHRKVMDKYNEIKCYGQM